MMIAKRSATETGRWFGVTVFILSVTLAIACGSKGSQGEDEQPPSLAAQVAAKADALSAEAEQYSARGAALGKKLQDLRGTEANVADDKIRAAIKQAGDAVQAEIEAWNEKGSALGKRGQTLKAVTTSVSAEATAAGAERAAKPGSDSPVMQMGAKALGHADSLERESTQYIARGNRLRKQVAKLRVIERTLADGDMRATVKEAIDILVAEIEVWEGEGKELRAHGRQLGELALRLMIDGFDDLWGRWISNPSPLVMDAVEFQVMAHNTQIRTVQPSKQGAIPTTGELPQKHQGMSIRVPALSGQNAPDELNVSSFQVSRERGLFAHVEVEPEADSNTPEPVPLNQIHRWRLVVSDSSGKPVENAAIEVVGHMPGHVHGLPTQPRATGEVAPGVYRVDGMKFQMNGWWVMQFNIEHEGRNDSVRFNLVL